MHKSSFRVRARKVGYTPFPINRTHLFRYSILEFLSFSRAYPRFSPVFSRHGRLKPDLFPWQSCAFPDWTNRCLWSKARRRHIDRRGTIWGRFCGVGQCPQIGRPPYNGLLSFRRRPSAVLYDQWWTLFATANIRVGSKFRVKHSHLAGSPKYPCLHKWPFLF